MNESLSLIYYIVFGLACITAIGNIGLWFFVSWSRNVFTIGVLGTTLIALSFGPAVRAELQF